MSHKQLINESSLPLEEWRDLLHRELVELGQVGLGASASLQAATTYVLQGHGKRLRGILCMAIQSDISCSNTKRPHALSSAVALEILHAASLVHDDLPALDNDDMRRGRASCHRAFNESTAILTGDYLVGRAFSVVADGSLTSTQQLRVLATLARAWSDLCIGQQIDIERPAEPEKLQTLMELKTGALFGASAACGVICADGDDAAVAAFYEWGKRVGVLFQKLDDVEDGDGKMCAGFSKDLESSVLDEELRVLHKGPMVLTRAVFNQIIGRSL